MTLREVAAMLKCINVRKHNTFVQQASLHGAKIPYKTLDENKIEFTHEQDELLMSELKKAQARKTAEIKGRQSHA